ncbi:MAG: hypothetical protein QOE90_975 [Thermoplasmata archaeon]|jgi:hypothetical protein|nr:hypothetical protein [Thermoplasmata archaeon]
MRALAVALALSAVALGAYGLWTEATCGAKTDGRCVAIHNPFSWIEVALALGGVVAAWLVRPQALLWLGIALFPFAVFWSFTVASLVAPLMGALLLGASWASRPRARAG